MKSRFAVVFMFAALLLQANLFAFAAGRNDSEERFRQQQQEARSQQEQALRAQEEAARNAQRQQEEAQRRAEEQAQRQQEEAQRRAEEQAQRQQEAAQRQAQEQAQRQQEAAQRQAQEQAQRQQEAAQRQAQEQAQRQQQAAERQAQEQAQREQMAAEQRLQEQAIRQQAVAQQHAQEEAQRAQVAAQRQFEAAPESTRQQVNRPRALQPVGESLRPEMQVEQLRAQMVPPPTAPPQTMPPKPVLPQTVPLQTVLPQTVPPHVQPPARELPPTLIARPSAVSPVVEPRPSFPREVRLPATTPGADTPPAFSLNRRAIPRPLNVKALPLKQAVAIPVIDSNLTSEEAQHCQIITRNLQQHLLPVPMSQAPPNVYQVRNIAINNYYNNYNTIINEQPICINRSTTFINPVPTYQYPYWYQPQQGWVFSNGFTLGNLFRIGLDWLGFGWHPYYGPAPQGFIAAANYMPTEWIYVPAYGLWRHVGLPGWAPSGPPLWYTGPISVEVLEPRHVRVRDPFTGWSHRRVINVVYLYNAFFYPMYDRWAYLNRHGNFIWLNT